MMRVKKNAVKKNHRANFFSRFSNVDKVQSHCLNYQPTSNVLTLVLQK